MKTTIIAAIHENLQQHIDLKYKELAPGFFKESIKLYGVRTPQVRTIAQTFTKKLKHLPISTLWEMSEHLLKTGYIEDATIACALVYNRKKEWTVADFKTLEHWLHDYVSNWGTCDNLSNHLFGYCIEVFPEVLPAIHTWTQSSNRWVRRAAAVSLILPARHGKNLDDIIRIADTLMPDTDDLVQKGCGWMLKEASKKHQWKIVCYIEKHKNKMPRTMLRYAIELMPPAVKHQLMNKKTPL